MEPFYNYSPAEVVEHFRRSDGQTVRYNYRDVKLNWCETLILFFTYGRWRRVRRDFIPICPGEPGYEDALYESTVIFDRAEMARIKQLYPEP